MNKVITINLGGNAFPLEENGYEALRAYLDTAARRLEGNPDKAEIIADIELAIAEKFRAVLGAYKTVVVTREVEKVIAEMGPVQDPSGEEEPAGPGNQAAEAATPPPKRLHTIREGAMIGGVCNGLAAYFGIDVALVRIAFVMLVLCFGTGALLYIVMMIVIPTAHTPEERAAATGRPFTTQEFIRRAKEGYYEGMKSFSDKAAWREWKQRFKWEMKGWKRDFHREMRENARHWRHYWWNTWPPPGRNSPAAFIVLPILAIINAVIALVAVLAAVSLFTTGLIFGLALPFSVPLWLGIVLLFVLYKIAVWPLKSVRHAYYLNGVRGPGLTAALVGIVESLMWVAFLLFLVWFAHHHQSEFHRQLHHLALMLGQVESSIQGWWHSR